MEELRDGRKERWKGWKIGGPHYDPLSLTNLYANC